MAYVRFGFAGPGDDLPTDQWMDGRTDYLAQRDSLDAAGREAWDASTRSGDNFQASQPSDVVALGSTADRADDGTAIAAPGAAETAEASTPAPNAGAQSPPLPRYVKAGPGDTITRLVGSSDPNAVGAFARANGMDGRNSTIYPGRVYALPASVDAASPDDTKLGEHLLRHDNARVAVLRAQGAANDQFSARLNAGLNVWTGRDPYSAPHSTPGPSDLVGKIANAPHGPLLAQTLGVGAGIARGVVHTGEDLASASVLGLRLMNPAIDATMAPFGGTAADQVAAAGQKIAAAAGDRVLHPSHLAQDALNMVETAKHDLLPSGTPQASTPREEVIRRFRIGENQGEVGFNGAMILAAPASEAVEAASMGSKAAEIDRFLAQGHTLAEAEHLAEPYMGKGHHVLAQRYDWPTFLSESPFFLLRPKWMNRGRFYERHFHVDPYMKTARMKDGMPAWSGERIGLEKFGPLGQFWFGTTTPFRTVVGGLAAANNAEPPAGQTDRLN